MRGLSLLGHGPVSNRPRSRPRAVDVGVASLLGASVWVASVLGVPEPATAQEATQSVLEAGEGYLECVERPTCATDDDCADESLPDLLRCEPLPNESAICSPWLLGKYDILCCQEDADCGERGGVVGRCVPVLESDAEIAICVWPRYFDLCGRVGQTGTTRETLGSCLDLQAEYTWDYYARGDCDDDEHPNLTDPCPCDPTDACAETPDAGVDGGVIRVDAGVPAVDAGTSPIDGGPGSDRPTGASFRGEGGCAIDGTRGTPDHAAGIASLVLAAAVVRRRRRGRPRAELGGSRRDL